MDEQTKAKVEQVRALMAELGLTVAHLVEADLNEHLAEAKADGADWCDVEADWWSGLQDSVDTWPENLW